MPLYAFLARYRFIATVACAVVITAAVTSHAQAIAAGAGSAIQQFTASSCTSKKPCLQWTNDGVGAAMLGVSKKGIGLIGQTTWQSTATSNAAYGVAGEDASASTFNSGVWGISGSGTGVTAVSSSGNAIDAISTSGVGLAAQSSMADGIYSFTTNPSATDKIGRAAVSGHDSSTDGGSLNFGVAGFSTSGVGIYGRSTNYIGAQIVGGANSNASLSLSGVSVAFGELIDACADSVPCEYTSSDLAFQLFSDGGANFLNTDGDLVSISGPLTVGGRCTGCASITANTSSGTRVGTYAPRVSVPTVDDVGEGRLVHGLANVAIDPSFGAIMDRTRTYLVFITPEGDCNGLYVADRTASGFSVRELRGGSSTISFAYRIVAKPFDTDAARLPLLPPVRHATVR
jgi:hypothetical protein